MPEPKKEDGFAWDILLTIAKFRLGISPQEFWKLTFAEFWPLFNVVTQKQARPLTKNDLKKLEGKLLNGEFRRIGG